jgi:2,3-diketo-5-methylthiopentyl-1-phosphate enolase
MVNVYAVGYAAVQELTSEPGLNVPVLGHPAFAGTFFEAPNYGLSSSLVLGKFARLSGVDMIIYPSPYGKVPLMRERAIRVAQELTSPLGHLKRVFPGPAAGMHPGTVAQSIKDFGRDLVVGAGGGIHGHPKGTIAGGKAFHQAIDAAMKGQPAAEAAKKHPELREALALWGDTQGGSIYSLLR